MHPCPTKAGRVRAQAQERCQSNRYSNSAAGESGRFKTFRAALRWMFGNALVPFSRRLEQLFSGQRSSKRERLGHQTSARDAETDMRYEMYPLQ